MIVSKSQLNRFPSRRLGAAEHSFDDLHVADGVFDWRGDSRVVENGLRKQIALDAVLVADVEGNFSRIVALLMPHLGWTVWRSVKRDFKLDPTRVAKDVDALIAAHLC